MTARQRAAKRAAANKKYRQSENGRAKTLEAYKRYRKTEKGREAHKRNR